MNKTVVWIFGSEQEQNPFIKLGIKSLVAKEYRVSLCDLRNKRSIRETDFSISQTIEKADIVPKGKNINPKAGQYIAFDQDGDHNNLLFPKLKRTIKKLDRKVFSGFFGRIYQSWVSNLVVSYYRSAPFRLIFSSLLVLFKERPSIVICSNPYYLVVASLYKFIHPCRLVYYPFELTGEQVKNPLFLETSIETWFIRSTIDSLITQNECRADVYGNERRARVSPVIVHNYKHIHPRPPILSREEVFLKFGFLPGQRLIVYEGQLFSGRNLENLVTSLKYLDKNIRMLFIGKIGKGNKVWWDETIEPIIHQEVIQARFTKLPFTTGDELHAIISAADVGVILYDNSCRNNYFCEPGKLSDFLEAGIPIIMPDFPTVRRVVDEFGIGVCINENTPEDISKAVKAILSTSRGEWMGHILAARDLLSWETQEPNFIRAVTGQQGSRLRF